MTLESGVAECQRRGLTLSDCLDLLDGSNACGDRLPTSEPAPADASPALVAVAPKNDRGFGGGPILYSCSSVPSARKSAILLQEAMARAQANASPPWLLIGGGVLAAGVVLYLVAR